MATPKNNKKELSVLNAIMDNELFKNLSFSKQDIDELKLKVFQKNKGDLIYQLGDSARSIFLVVDGEIDLIKKQSYGKTHSNLTMNKFFGHEEYLLGTSRNSIAAALKDSSLIELSSEVIEKLISRDSSILSNIKGSLLDLDSASMGKIEQIIDQLTESVEKLPLLLPNKQNKNNYKKATEKSVGDKQFTAELKMQSINKIESNKIEAGINSIISNINSSLSLLEEEKKKMREEVFEYENHNQILRKEMQELKERELRVSKLDKEKNEILINQSYRIADLEKEMESIKSEYLKKNQLIALQNENYQKSKAELEKLQRIIDNKEEIITNLASKVSELQTRIDEQLEIVKNRSEQIQNQSGKISEYEQQLKSYNKELSEQIETINNFTQEVTELSDNLRKKESEIYLQNKRIVELNLMTKELQQKGEQLESKIKEYGDIKKELLVTQDTVEKKNKRIGELDTLTGQLRGELSQKTETINDFAKEISELSENVRQKEAEIHEQNKTIVELNAITKDFQNVSRQLEIKIRETADLKRDLDEFKNSVEKKNSRINDLDNVISQLRTELSQKIDTINNFAKEISEQSENIRQKESQMLEQEKTILELNTLSRELNNKNEQLEEKVDEYFETKKELRDLKATLDKKNKAVKDRDELIYKLKAELAEASDLRNELSTIKNENVSAHNAFDELKNENKNLSERIRELKSQVEEGENKISNLTRVSDQFNKLKADEEKYKYNLVEKDKKIKEMEERYEALRVTKSAQIKTLNAKKNDYESEIKKKNIQITELMGLVKHLQSSLSTKNFNDNQHVEIIQDQLQKIQELEMSLDSYSSAGSDFSLVEDSSEKKSDEYTLSEDVLQSRSAFNESSEYSDSDEESEILSKADLIASKYADTSNPKDNFEHYKYSDLQIVNVNITRATMDVVAPFKELMQQVINADQCNVIVNLSKCEFIDSSILGVLVSSIKSATELGGDLRLVGLHPAVHSMMELTRMYGIFPTYPSLEEAVASFE